MNDDQNNNLHQDQPGVAKPNPASQQPPQVNSSPSLAIGSQLQVDNDQDSASTQAQAAQKKKGNDKPRPPKVTWI